MSNPQTPLERLISDKENLLRQCERQERKLNEDFTYIQENAGSLLLSGLSYLLFPGSKSTSKTEETAPAASSGQSAIAWGLSDYLSIAKSMVPVAWEIVQPILLTWGIKKAKKWLAGLLSRKKK